MNIDKGKSPRGIHYHHYRSQGQPRQTLALVMGYSGSIASWTPEFLAELAGRFDVLVFDNRGTGHSFHPDKVEDITALTMAEDLAELLGHLGIPRLHLLGYSLGGCVAQQYAELHPGSLHSLLLMSTTGGGKGFAHPGPGVLEQLANPSGNSALEVTFSIFRLCLSEKTIQDNHSQLLEMTDRLMAKPVPRRTLKGQMLAFRGFDNAGFATLLHPPFPVTVLSGKQDRLVPQENSLHLHRQIPGSRLVLIDDCEHMPYIEQPATLVQAVFAATEPHAAP